MTDAVATRYAGTRVPRVEDTRLLTGHGTFVDDVSRPGMLHACFVRSPFARARINGIDTSAALAHARRARGVRGRRPEPGREGGLARGRGQGHAGHSAPAAGRGRGEVRRRPGRSRRRREPVHRRGRRRAGRRRLRTAARRRRLHQGRELRRRRPRGVPRQCRVRIGGRAAGRGDILARPRTSCPKPSTSRCMCRCRWRRAASSSSGWPPRER